MESLKINLKNIFIANHFSQSQICDLFPSRFPLYSSRYYYRLFHHLHNLSYLYIYIQFFCVLHIILCGMILKSAAKTRKVTGHGIPDKSLLECWVAMGIFRFFFKFIVERIADVPFISPH